MSKNWHHKVLPPYLRSYMVLPLKPGINHYLIRIPYGFYGTLPSASHAQLSLVGYGGNGRWEQMAIGTWGETKCLDIEMSLTDRAITDVRALMIRKGLFGKKWGWTDSGWGGDWLVVRNSKGQKLRFNEMKVAYLAQGPCLTDVRYGGYYGADREVAVKAKLQTLRTDDYARTFYGLTYTFNKRVSAKDSCLFKMGTTPGLCVPEIAYGNRSGLLAENGISADVRNGVMLLDHVPFSGAAPWWVAFPGAEKDTSKPIASRALIIRSCRYTLGGKDYSRPSISMPVVDGAAPGKKGANVDLWLVPPAGVTEYVPGDRIELELEWVALPRTADDYYGPNEAFRKHLAANPRSWKSVYREAVGNDLKIVVEGGRLEQNYPIVIKAEKPEVTVDITGGVGEVVFTLSVEKKGWTAIGLRTITLKPAL